PLTRLLPAFWSTEANSQPSCAPPASSGDAPKNVAKEQNSVLAVSDSSVWSAHDLTVCMLNRYASMPRGNAANSAAAAGNEGGGENIAAVIASFCERNWCISARHVAPSLT